MPKIDFEIDPNTGDIKKLSGKESVINVFVKNLLTKRGSDFFDPDRGTDVLDSTTEGRITVEVESAYTQTVNMIASTYDRFGVPTLLGVKIINVNVSGGKLALHLAFIFGDKINIEKLIELRGTS